MKLLTAWILIAVFFFTSNGQYTTIHDFEDGDYPNGSIYFDGIFFYGMTARGGAYNEGTIYKIKPDGSGYIKLLDFNSVINGAYPSGNFVSDGNFLYGLAEEGGSHGKGVLFKIKPDGTGFIKLFDFDGSPNGRYPQGSLMFDGTYLYGMTSYGGTNDDGVIFKIKTDGSGFERLFDFYAPGSGGNPMGALVSDSIFLYGMTYHGGTYDQGTVFKLKPDGTSFNKLVDFNGSLNGSNPQGSVIFNGRFLYGMTLHGGEGGAGVIFKINPDSATYTKLHDFQQFNFGSDEDGGYPWGDLVSVDAYLYGTTIGGGIPSLGTLFKIKPDGSGYSKLIDFDGDNGDSPAGTLISDGVFLYGTTRYGGPDGGGVIFKFQDTTATGISDHFSQINFSIYPNPANRQVTIEMKNEIGAEVNLYNIYGDKVYETRVNEKASTINLNMPEGIYFIHVRRELKTAGNKLIIKH